MRTAPVFQNLIALVVGVDNGISGARNQFSTEVRKIKVHGLAFQSR